MNFKLDSKESKGFSEKQLILIHVILTKVYVRPRCTCWVMVHIMGIVGAQFGYSTNKNEEQFFDAICIIKLFFDPPPIKNLN